MSAPSRLCPPWLFTFNMAIIKQKPLTFKSNSPRLPNLIDERCTACSGWTSDTLVKPPLWICTGQHDVEYFPKREREMNTDIYGGMKSAMRTGQWKQMHVAKLKLTSLHGMEDGLLHLQQVEVVKELEFDRLDPFDSRWTAFSWCVAVAWLCRRDQVGIAPPAPSIYPTPPQCHP